MSAAQPHPQSGADRQDNLVPLIAYILYLIGLTHGVTILIAVILAYVKRKDAAPVAASHLDWIIRTFWLSLGWVLLAMVLILAGIPLALIGIGFLLIGAGLAIWGLIVVWTVIRLIVGLVGLSRDEAYPRPQAPLF